MAKRGPGLEGIDAANPAFRRLLCFSFLLHLSTVTIFNIVVYLPAREIKYFNFEVVEMRRPAAATAAAASPNNARLRLGGAPGLPEIVLPTLEFATLERLRIRQAGIDDPGLYGRDPAVFATKSSALAAAETELAVAEEQWLALEILREEQ